MSNEEEKTKRQNVDDCKTKTRVRVKWGHRLLIDEERRNMKPSPEQRKEHAVIQA